MIIITIIAVLQCFVILSSLDHDGIIRDHIQLFMTHVRGSVVTDPCYDVAACYT